MVGLDFGDFYIGFEVERMDGWWFWMVFVLEMNWFFWLGEMKRFRGRRRRRIVGWDGYVPVCDSLIIALQFTDKNAEKESGIETNTLSHDLIEAGDKSIQISEGTLGRSFSKAQGL